MEYNFCIFYFSWCREDRDKTEMEQGEIFWPTPHFERFHEMNKLHP
jgi:hypothetical protein